MGKNSRQRREARRRAVGRPTRAPSFEPGGARGPADRDEIDALIDIACRFATAAPRALGPRVARLNELGAAATTPGLDPAALVVHEVMSIISTAWENGWQPLDLVHATRRQTSAREARWITAAILVESQQSSAMDRAPRRWVDQLRTLAGRHGDTDAKALLATRGGAVEAQWLPALVVLDLLRTLPASQRLMPPPSRWGQPAPPRASGAPTARHGSDRARTLTRVRALLAKAESTEFAAEAEAFTAKAQDLMTRHSIDEALLAGESGSSIDVDGVRVLVDQPYANEKASLLHVVARANRVRAVWNEFAAYVTLVGLPTDVEQSDMLFTSTLVQATRAMTLADLSTASFRRAFLQAFAVRIGERLEASSEQAVASYGTSLVPVLERQSEAIDAEVDRLFPRLTSGSRTRQLDLRGWDAGTRAADAAVLPAGAVES